jgi:hypothetical protein
MNNSLESGGGQVANVVTIFYFVTEGLDCLTSGLYHKNITIIIVMIANDAPSCSVTYDNHCDG